MLYPEANDGSPGTILADQGIRTTFAAGSQEPIEIYNEFLDVSRLPGADYQQELAGVLRRKYSGRKVDLVIAGLGSGLNFALEHRDEIFPDVPIVFLAVDRKEIESRQLPADVIGHPITMDLARLAGAGTRFSSADGAPLCGRGPVEVRRVLGSQSQSGVRPARGPD